MLKRIGAPSKTPTAKRERGYREENENVKMKRPSNVNSDWQISVKGKR